MDSIKVDGIRLDQIRSNDIRWSILRFGKFMPSDEYKLDPMWFVEIRWYEVQDKTR